ncbi:MAG: serine/threonine-protein phosphatase [Marmoricola sp.]|nr:serine/threonine-protein phosphatase [Marmoricola sp.]
MVEGLRRYLGDPVATWQTGSSQSQALTLAALLIGVAACFVVSIAEYALMPMTAYYVWLLLGMLLLRFRPLVVLSTVAATASFVAVLHDPPMTGPRITACFTMLICLSLILFASSRQRTGLPGPMGEALLTDLRRRLQSQGTIPRLPEGWRSHSEMIAANDVGYGGDFVVAHCSDDDKRLELILVDVTGKGVSAASRALQFGGALGGLVGALPPQGLFAAANDFLLRQDSDDTFATAVHVLLDLETGAYELTSAGHPPALVWSGETRAWTTDPAHGTALGIVPCPEMHTSTGTLRPGDALMVYTDGVVESRYEHLDKGVAWLQQEAAEAVFGGFAGSAARIIERVTRADDDRALLIIERSPERTRAASEEDQLQAS